MTRFIQGILVGVILALGLGFTVAVVADDQTKAHLAETLTDVVTQYCDVDVGYGRRSVSSTCSFNRVMSGFDGEYIYCSDVEVRCSLD